MADYAEQAMERKTVQTRKGEAHWTPHLVPLVQGEGEFTRTVIFNTELKHQQLMGQLVIYSPNHTMD